MRCFRLLEAVSIFCHGNANYACYIIHHHLRNSKKLQWDFRSEISKQRETNILAVLRFQNPFKRDVFPCTFQETTFETVLCFVIIIHAGDCSLWAGWPLSHARERRRANRSDREECGEEVPRKCTFSSRGFAARFHARGYAARACAPFSPAVLQREPARKLRRLGIARLSIRWRASKIIFLPIVPRDIHLPKSAVVQDQTWCFSL